MLSQLSRQCYNCITVDNWIVKKNLLFSALEALSGYTWWPNASEHGYFNLEKSFFILWHALISVKLQTSSPNSFHPCTEPAFDLSSSLLSPSLILFPKTAKKNEFIKYLIADGFGKTTQMSLLFLWPGLYHLNAWWLLLGRVAREAQGHWNKN